MKTIDIHEEVLILPFRSGGRLTLPSHHSPMMSHSVKKIFSLPLHAYFLGKDSTVLSLNERNALACGGTSQKDIIGKSVERFLNKEIAGKIINNGLHVIKNEKCFIFNEAVDCLKNDFNFPSISLKYPLYDKNNKIQGIFGFSLIFDHYLELSTLIDFFNLIQKLGFFNFSDQIFFQDLILNRKINSFYLSSQEINCLRLVLKGMTAKMIAKKLNISFRTVECHLSRVRLKFKVNSKSELIEKVMSLSLS